MKTKYKELALVKFLKQILQKKKKMWMLIKYTKQM